MDNYLITATILCLYLTTTVAELNLHQQNANQDQLNPLNDQEHADGSAREQDKRTIFNSANYGWAKHIGIKPSGHKYILGYTPVDLKYTPVIRPLQHHGYVYGKPKIHFHINKPAVQLRPARPIHPTVWKPVPVKPLPLPPHHHHLVSKPVGIAHADHVDVRPVQHVDHVHQVQVPHGDHVHNVPVHVDHVHPVAAPQPVAVPLPQHLIHFAPSPLFEVTKPELGVLPLGAVFQSPVLRNIQGPAVVPLHLKPFLPQHVPLPRPALIPQPTYPPGTVVEYHGATNFLNQVPVSVNAVQPFAPPHVHLQYPQIQQHIPFQPAHTVPHEQHDVQTPIIPNNHPHFIQQPIDQSRFQQQLPLGAPPHFQQVEQTNNDHLFQQQLPISTHDQNNQQFIQQLPQDSGPRYQPADQVSTQQFFQGSINPQQSNFELDSQEGGYVYPQPDTAFESQSIQPGNSDLQFPVHLPQHPGFIQNSRQIQEASQLQSVFRPSIQLEPPYNKKK